MFGKTQSKEVTIDPVRAALAVAIFERDEAARNTDAAKAAVERASALLETASARLSSAVAALVERRKVSAERVLEAVSAGAEVLPDISMREARASDLDAVDAMDAAKAALTACMASRAEAEADLRHAEWRVEKAAAPILAGEADRVLVEVERLKDELNGAHAVLAFLQSSLEPGSPLQHRVMFALPSPPPGVFAPDYRNHPALAAWRDAREALMRDADAALPKASE
jgi:hypothetical protein